MFAGVPWLLYAEMSAHGLASCLWADTSGWQTKFTLGRCQELKKPCGEEGSVIRPALGPLGIGRLNTGGFTRGGLASNICRFATACKLASQCATFIFEILS